MGNALQETKSRTSLVAKIAGKFSVEPDKLLETLKTTAFKQPEGQPPVTNEQMMALLVVADQYGLNPFTREIFAFADKRAGIVPVVGVDGWSRIINDHPMSDGFEFRESDKQVTPTDGKACPEWMEVVIYRKDRTHPNVVREYIDEVYQPKRGGYNGPWQTHTKRMFRHKVLIQGARVAYGFGGIYDEDEAQRIVDMGAAEVVQRPTAVLVSQPRAKSDEKSTPAAEDAIEAKDAPIGDNLIPVIRAKLTAATLTEAELFKHFDVKQFGDLRTSQLDAIWAFIKNPG